MWIKVIILVALLPLVHFTAHALTHTNIKRYLIIVGHASLLTISLFLFANDPDFILSEQLSLIKAIEPINGAKRLIGRNFIDSNILAIDVSNDKIPKKIVDKQTKMPVVELFSDKEKLTRVFEVLNNNLSNIDLVILDLDINNKQGSNCQLWNQMIKSLDSHLLIAKQNSRQTDTCFNFPDKVFGNVSEKVAEGATFASHKIYDHQDFSLAYKIYTKISKLQDSHIILSAFLCERDSLGYNSVNLNVFIPPHYLDDIDILPANKRINGSINQQNNDVEYLKSQTFRQVNELIDPQGAAWFKVDIDNRKQIGKRNIIFIGNFLGSDDLHHTSFGDAHGPAIILNNVVALLNRSHQIHYYEIVAIFLFFLFLTWLTVVLKLFEVRRASLIGLLPPGTLSIANRLFPHVHTESSTGNKFTDFISSIAELFFEQLHLVLLGIIVLIFSTFSSVWLNGVSYFIYFAILSRLLVFYFKHLSDET